MDKKYRWKKERLATKDDDYEEVNSVRWELINMNEDEQDIIYRMHKLVGDRWDLIAGRIPGRKAEEIERFWIMKHSEWFGVSRRSKRRRSY